MKRLRDERTPRGDDMDGVLSGRLTVSEIRLPLKPDFMAKIGTVHGRLPTQYIFFAIIMCLLSFNKKR